MYSNKYKKKFLEYHHLNIDTITDIKVSNLFPYKKKLLYSPINIHSKYLKKNIKNSHTENIDNTENNVNNTENNVNNTEDNVNNTENNVNNTENIDNTENNVNNTEDNVNNTEDNIEKNVNEIVNEIVNDIVNINQNNSNEDWIEINKIIDE